MPPVYVVDQQVTLRVINVTNPGTPQVVTTVPIADGGIRRLARSNGWLFGVGTMLDEEGLTGALFVFDLASPGHPDLVAQMPIDCLDAAYALWIDGGVCYVAGGDNSPTCTNAVAAIDVSNPCTPVLLGVEEMPGYATSSLSATDDALVVGAANFGGLMMLEKQCEGPATIQWDEQAGSRISLAVSPTPAAVRSPIRFSTDVGRLISVAVFDVTGRLVRRLVNGHHAPDNHALLWDGRDNYSHHVPGGLYLVRGATTEGSAAGRLVVIR